MLRGVSRSGFVPSDCDMPEYCEYTYTKWAPYQPNFAWGAEYCIHLRPDNTWNNNVCNVLLASICETAAV